MADITFLDRQLLVISVLTKVVGCGAGALLSRFTFKSL